MSEATQAIGQLQKSITQDIEKYKHEGEKRSYLTISQDDTLNTINCTIAAMHDRKLTNSQLQAIVKLVSKILKASKVYLTLKIQFVFN